MLFGDNNQSKISVLSVGSLERPGPHGRAVWAVAGWAPEDQDTIALRFSPSGSHCFLSVFVGGDGPPVTPRPLQKFSLEMNVGVWRSELGCGSQGLGDKEGPGAWVRRAS